MPTSITTTVDPSGVVAALTAQAGRLRDLGPFFRAVVSPAVTRLLEEQFATGGERMAADGSGWAALRPSTVKRKGQDSILIDSMQMMEAYLHPDLPDGLEAIGAQTYTRGVTGFAEQKAEWAVKGWDGSHTPPPPREPRAILGDGIPRDVLRAMSDALSAYVITGGFA